MQSIFIDIGLNLMNKQFVSDREHIIQRAEEAGVMPLILTGTSLQVSQEAAFFAEKHIGKLYSTAGIHPHDVKSCTDQTIEDLRSLLKKPVVVAVGECGLDYNRDFSPRDVQRKYFEKQIQLAIEENKPLFLHERAAFFDFFKMLEDRKKELPAMVVHCFTGNAYELDRYLHLGAYIGITGWICDEKRGMHLRDLVKQIPHDKIMIETDAPFLIPRNLKPFPKNRRNEPAFLPYICSEIASCLSMEKEELAKICKKNTMSFFQL